jgi:SET domain-containing protein
MFKKYEVRPSQIHGLGVFATRNIKRGDLVGIYEGRETRRNGTYVLWVVDEETGSEVGVEGTGELRYLNHSPSPNCSFDGTELSSLVDITAGEELTFHYGDDWA